MTKSRSYQFIISKPSNKDLTLIKEKLSYDYISVRYNDSSQLEGFIHHRHQIQQSALENKITKATFQIYDFKNYIKNYENIKETLHTEIGIPPQQGKKPNLTDIRNKIIEEDESFQQIIKRYPILFDQSDKYIKKLIEMVLDDLTLSQKMELFVAIFANKIKQTQKISSNENSALKMLFVSILSFLGFKIHEIGSEDYELFTDIRESILTYLDKNKLSKISTNTFNSIKKLSKKSKKIINNDIDRILSDSYVLLTGDIDHIKLFMLLEKTSSPFPVIEHKKSLVK